MDEVRQDIGAFGKVLDGAIRGVEKNTAWCYYEKNYAAGALEGKLYNAIAMMDPRGLAPEGYHAASGFDWIRLASYLGGSHTAGLEMKKDSGFNALTRREIFKKPS